MATFDVASQLQRVVYAARWLLLPPETNGATRSVTDSARGYRTRLRQDLIDALGGLPTAMRRSMPG
jgi:hypothetical protein